MKRILMALFLFSSVAFADSRTVNITVKGMVCGFCAQGIIKKFKAEPSVEKVDVSLEKQLVTLSLKEGQDIKDEKIKEIVRYAGYDLEKIEHAK